MIVRKHEIKGIWEQQLNEVFTDTKKTDMALLFDIFSVIMFERLDESLGILYTIIDDHELFTKIVNNFSGMTIKIPERQEFADAVTLGMTYFYKEIKKMKWEDIKKELPYEDKLPLKTGKGLVKLNNTIKEKLNDILKEGNNGLNS